jgi:intracellular sulfur oxidation DsrE/DsrF family protein
MALAFYRKDGWPARRPGRHAGIVLYYSSHYPVFLTAGMRAGGDNMKKGMALLAVVVLIGGLVYLYHALSPGEDDAARVATDQGEAPDANAEPAQPEAEASRGVFDISVHSIEELEVLFERAEEIASRPRAVGGGDSIVLVLHGPEVEFFAISNYDRYRSIVDRAARLDAFQVVDVKICQTMMERFDIGQDDIPAFIEQVPDGAAEVDRLTREGYIYF